MNGSLLSHRTPEEISHLRKNSSRKSIREIGLTLADELGEIIERLGSDHPGLNRVILRYITRLDERHPEWRSAMEQARHRLIGGKLSSQRRGGQ